MCVVCCSGSRRRERVGERERERERERVRCYAHHFYANDLNAAYAYSRYVLLSF